jgi:hypothetical protein
MIQGWNLLRHCPLGQFKGCAFSRSAVAPHHGSLSCCDAIRPDSPWADIRLQSRSRDINQFAAYLIDQQQ